MGEVVIRLAQPNYRPQISRMITTGATRFARVPFAVLLSTLVSRLASWINDPGRSPASAPLLVLPLALLVASGLGIATVVLTSRTGQVTVGDSGNLAKKAGLLPAGMAAAVPLSGTGRVVAIDPGHGGAEIGAQYNFPDGTTLLEKDLNLRVALRVADLLAKAGYQPVLTRKTDSEVNVPPRLVTGRPPIGLDDDLQARVDIANNAKAQLFLSIHFNGSANRDLHGSEVYYSEDRPFVADSRQFAHLLRDNVVNGLAGIGYQQLGVVKVDMAALRPGEHFYVLGPESDIIVRPSAMPAALAEGLFLTNTYDAGILRDERTLDVIALAYATAVHQYFAGDSSKLPDRPPVSGVGRGTIATGEGVGALLRAVPNTTGDIVRALPDGATIDLLQTVNGEAVVPGDTRWYRARYDGNEGYVYAALLLNSSGSSPVRSTGMLNSLGKGTVKTRLGTGALMRAEPDSSGDVVRALPEGEIIDLLQLANGEAVVPGDTSWYQARYDGDEGYVYAMLVLKSSSTGSVISTGVSSSLGKGTVKTQLGTGALLRAEPDTTGDIVRALPDGTTVDLLQTATGEAVIPGDGRWYRARFDGNEGYVYATLVTRG